jgi:hypothetical protein
MTPEEEFERWWDLDSNGLRLVCSFDKVRDNVKEAFLTGYDRGKELGYGQGWEQGYDDKEEMLRFREWTSQTK